MIKESITIDDVVKLLNDALFLDSKAMRNLIESRVICNKNLANHPTIQVGNYHSNNALKEYRVGILGIINGLFGINKSGNGPIAAILNIICPNHFKHNSELIGTENPGDQCPICSAKLVLGNLIEFIRIDESSSTPEPIQEGEITTCGRRMGESGPWEHRLNLDRWEIRKDKDFRQCSFCGSIHPEDFEKILNMIINGEKDIRIERALGKAYKIYIYGFEQGSFYKYYTQHNPSQEWVDKINPKFNQAMKISKISLTEKRR